MNSMQNQNNAALYTLRQVTKVYPSPGEKVHVLKGISMDIHEGETIAVVGASGCGKSTLLHLLGTLATPTSGQIFFRGADITALGNKKKAALRNKDMGFVFQFHYLLPEFSTVENVAMQAIIGGMNKKEALDKAREALKVVGLEARESFSVTYLSGGERQRAAIARALLNNPSVLLADEPTGNLDEKNGQMVAELLRKINQEQKTAMVVVTHNPSLAALMDKCYEIKAGELYEQKC